MMSLDLEFDLDKQLPDARQIPDILTGHAGRKLVDLRPPLYAYGSSKTWGKQGAYRYPVAVLRSAVLLSSLECPRKALGANYPAIVVAALRVKDVSTRH